MNAAPENATAVPNILASESHFEISNFSILLGRAKLSCSRIKNQWIIWSYSVTDTTKLHILRASSSTRPIRQLPKPCKWKAGPKILEKKR